MGKMLDDRYADEVKDEVLNGFDELTSEMIIPGLVLAIRKLAAEFPDPDRILDEVVYLLEEGE